MTANAPVPTTSTTPMAGCGPRRMLDVAPRLRQLGRLRLGRQVPTGRDGKMRPERLSTWRLTSPSRELVDAAAALYGGEVAPWASPAGAQWEVVTETAVVDVLLPPLVGFSSSWEQWTAGGCQRRCDGAWDEIRRGDCDCPRDLERRRELATRDRPEACRPVTRLAVVLPRLPDVGTWTLTTSGMNAAAELAGAAAIADRATASGRMLPARLRIEERVAKVAGEGTRRYVVPVVEIPVALDQVLDSAGTRDALVLGASDDVPALEASPRSDGAPALEAPPASSGFPLEIGRAPDPLEQLREAITAAGIPDNELDAMLRHGYGVGVLEDLPAGEVTKLGAHLATDAGVQRFRTAAAAHLERERLPRCVNCGAPAEVDADGWCPTCAVPF